jgi:hypothetical protein
MFSGFAINSRKYAGKGIGTFGRLDMTLVWSALLSL